MANLYEVTPKWKGNTITIHPKRRKRDRTIGFGLGNATMSFNLAYPPEETISIGISGETENVDLYPSSPFNATRWKQIASHVKEEEVDLSRAKDGSMMWRFQSAEFRKYRGVSAPVETSNYMARVIQRGERVEYLNTEGSLHTRILPPSSLGVNATDICIIKSFYSDFIAVLDEGVVTIHDIKYNSMHLIGNVNDPMTTAIKDKQEELLVSQEAKEIAFIDNKLHIRYKDGICLIYRIIEQPMLVKILANVLSLDGGVRTFSFKYAYDRNSNSTVPLVDGGRDDLSYFGGSDTIIVDGDLYKDGVVVDNGVVSSGVLKLSGHIKRFYNIWVNEDGSFKDGMTFNTAQLQYINKHKTVTPANQWAGYGDVGYIVPGPTSVLCTIDFVHNSNESDEEVKYLVKDNTISFPDNPEIEIVDVSNMSDFEKMEYIYTTDTKDKFLMSGIVAEYITKDVYGLNIGYASSPWVEFNSWKEV